MNAAKVFVILPTYNGEKYIEELLDSLYNQTYPLIEIFTRDDCSTDNTINIIKKYARKKVKGRKIHIIPNEGEQWRCPDCFIKLLEVAKGGDFYCYCDQDDVWLPTKIENAIKKIEKEGNDKPTLHFGSYYKCTNNLKIVGHSPKIPRKMSLEKIIYDYWPLGFNITFNAKLYNLIFSIRPKYIFYHDNWLAQVAAGVGIFCYSNNPSVLYRRQENAVTYSNHSNFSLFIWRIKQFLNPKSDNLIRLKKILIEYKDLYHEMLSEKDNKMLDIFTKDCLKNYFLKVFYPHRLRTNFIDEISLRILFLFKKL